MLAKPCQGTLSHGGKDRLDACDSDAVTRPEMGRSHARPRIMCSNIGSVIRRNALAGRRTMSYARKPSTRPTPYGMATHTDMVMIISIWTRMKVCPRSSHGPRRPTACNVASISSARCSAFSSSSSFSSLTSASSSSAFGIAGAGSGARFSSTCRSSWRSSSWSEAVSSTHSPSSSGVSAGVSAPTKRRRGSRCSRGSHTIS